MALYQRVLIALLLLLFGCSDPAVTAEKQAAEGNLPEAAKSFWQAAVQASCPQRGRYLLRRAEIQDQAGYNDLSITTTDQAIAACPSVPDGYLSRAQRYRAEGERELAMEDARIAKEQLPEAQALFSEIAIEIETERSIRDHAQLLIRTLKGAIDLNKPTRSLDSREPARLARQVPIPLTLRYRVTQHVKRPKEFQLAWEELISYRGNPAHDEYSVVQQVDLPPMANEIPLYHRLQLANRRLPMVFRIGPQGEVLDANWMRQGPDRGMRPDMLKPEIEARIKRRRIVDPGETGERAPGQRWSGEDVRVVDGKPLAIRYESHALGWVEIAGVRTLHVRSTLTGSNYSAQEERWLHPETSVAIRWTQSSSFSIETTSGTVQWREEISAQITGVTGSK